MLLSAMVQKLNEFQNSQLKGQKNPQENPDPAANKKNGRKKNFMIKTASIVKTSQSQEDHRSPGFGMHEVVNIGRKKIHL